MYYKNFIILVLQNDIIWSQRPIKSYDLSGKLYMCTFLRGDFSRDRRVGHLLSDKIYYARKE